MGNSKPIIALVLIAGSFIKSGGQAKKAAIAPLSASPSASAPDPVASFKQVVSKFQNFFSTGPRRLIWQVSDPINSRRPMVFLEEYSAQDISYDVEKTVSLVSPYSAFIHIKLTGKGNASCGDITGPTPGGYGWSSVAGALSAIDRPECYRWSPNPKRPEPYDLKFIFAFQEGRWIFKDAFLAEDAWICDMFNSLLGNASNAYITSFAAPQANALNSPWRDLVKN